MINSFLSLFRKSTGLVSSLALLLLLFFKPPLDALCYGKIDVGPAYVHVDILENQKTVKNMDMVAFKGDATILIYKGICLKPTVLYGSANGSVFSSGAGIGHCFPLFNQRLTLTPSIGCNFTHLRTTFSLHQLGLKNLKETFRSTSPYASLEATISLGDSWRICGLYQYAWSRTHTTIKNLTRDKSHSRGPNYGLLIEYDFAKNWSVNVGGAYNLTLTKEKHGLRGAGVKLGLVRWL